VAMISAAQPRNVTEVARLDPLRNRLVTTSLEPLASPPGPIKPGALTPGGHTVHVLPAPAGGPAGASRSPDKFFEEFM